MAKKPTYEELEQRVKELEKEVAKRKQAEDAPRESEEKYKTLTLTNNLNVGVYRVSPGTKRRFLEANPAYLRIYGYESREELFKSDVCDLYQNPADRKKFSEKMQRVVRLPITK